MTRNTIVRKYPSPRRAQGKKSLRINYETALLTIDMMIANKEKIVSYDSPIKIYKSNSDRLVSFILTFFSFLIGIIFVLYMNVKRRK